MIETSLSRVKIHEVIQSQIPEYIDFENPLFGEFLKQYYYSQEFQGGPVDIAENLTEYKSLDFLNTETLTGFTSLTSYIDGQATPVLGLHRSLVVFVVSAASRKMPKPTNQSI